MRKLEEYPYLSGEGMERRRSLLYFMICQGCSDVLIENLLGEEDGFSDALIDLIKSLILVTDEDFFYDRIYQKEQSLPQVLEAAAFHLVTKTYSLPEKCRSPDPVQDEADHADDTEADRPVFHTQTILSEITSIQKNLLTNERERSEALIRKTEEAARTKIKHLTRITPII